MNTLDTVLAALIQEPLAEEMQTSQGDIAKTLSHLENFTAIARVGAETHRIIPCPIPDAVVTGPDLWERKRTIQTKPGIGIVGTVKKLSRKWLKNRGHKLYNHRKMETKRNRTRLPYKGGHVLRMWKNNACKYCVCLLG